MGYNEKNNEENVEEIVSTPDYGRYGKIEFDYIEAGRQIIRLEIVGNEVASAITDAIGAIQELAGLVECECSINVNDLVNDNINANVDAIIERLNYEIKGYQDLAIEIGADIEELNSVIRDVVFDNSKDYQTALKKSRLYGKEFVYYNQYDYEGEKYGGSTIADSGCGPTCAAMILSTLLDEDVTPQIACNYSSSLNHLVSGGTEDAFFDDIFNEYGVSYTKEEQTKENIIASLEAGNYIIAHMGHGDFTTGDGHFIVLTGIDEYGNIIVADPASRENSSIVWSPSVFEDQRRGQGMYSVSL